MNYEQQIKLQAHLDGELSAAETKQVESWLAADPNARLLMQEMQTLRTVLRANEPEIKVPASREFYWSKIERAIQREETRPERGFDLTALLLAWRRFLAPVAGVAVVALVALLTFQNLPQVQDDNLVVIDNPSEEAGSISFRSQSENMFVVWVYNKDNPSPELGDDEEEAFYQ